MATNFHLAPPPTMVDGLLAVPIDIDTIDAVFTFDGAAQTASATATISYQVGPTAGNPVFDLRQTITSATLDGASLPPAQLAHHLMGAVPFTDVRVIESVQAAGSMHTLQLAYPLAMPRSQLGGSYLPVLQWSAGPRLRLVFGLSDLNRARYVEAWLPANLIFDQFSITLEIRIINTPVAHSIITSGTAAVLGTNHWRVTFPTYSSAVSPLLEVRAADTVTSQSDTVSLPVSGKTVTIEAWKPAASSENLTTQIGIIKGLLADNENDYGPYLHGDRFVAFFNGGGMEYEGGTTTSPGALAHETFHNWFARGIKPSSQADGWWDEGFTTFHDHGADDSEAFDFTAPPILLCSRDPWQRHTPGNSYLDGSRVWRGMAALLGVSDLNAHMGSLYRENKGNPVSTQMIEEHLLCKSGEPRVVDAFHRFVYGMVEPATAADLWLKDDPAHQGADQWEGTFWDSPDVWVRNQDDDGTAHQSPEFGQDNWLFARVRNRAGAGEAQHFAVTFRARGFAGTEFVYPGDFFPCVAAKVDFALPGGGVRVVKARWPREMVPPAGAHTCLLASVIARADHPSPSRHVWEHNNLAQKNLTIVDLAPDEFFILPVVLSNRSQLDHEFDLEVWRPETATGIQVGLIHRSKDLFRGGQVEVKRFEPDGGRPEPPEAPGLLDCGGLPEAPSEDRRQGLLTSRDPDRVRRRFREAFEACLPDATRTSLRVRIKPGDQITVGLKVAVTARSKPGRPSKLHLVQRQSGSKRIVGGVALLVNPRR
jgi:hypothetical protein